MRKIILIGLLTVFAATAAFAGKLLSVKSKDATSKDIPLKFILEKTIWNGDNLLIWGTVKNEGKTKYERVQVVFTALDAKKSFIGRNTWHVNPHEIAPGQVGYIEEKFVECDGNRPSRLEYSVLGED